LKKAEFLHLLKAAHEQSFSQADSAGVPRPLEQLLSKHGVQADPLQRCVAVDLACQEIQALM
jgi:hypothetical protein